MPAGRVAMRHAREIVRLPEGTLDMMPDCAAIAGGESAGVCAMTAPLASKAPIVARPRNPIFIGMLL